MLATIAHEGPRKGLGRLVRSSSRVSFLFPGVVQFPFGVRVRVKTTPSIGPTERNGALLSTDRGTDESSFETVLVRDYILCRSVPPRKQAQYVQAISACTVSGKCAFVGFCMAKLFLSLITVTFNEAHREFKHSKIK